jgi:L-iditol 2-dehydrogenase
VRAVVLDEAGEPRLADVPEPQGPGELVRVRACGLCGSDVEKLERGGAGTVLGHEVAAETEDGRRVALVHHLPCGECDRCRAGHESTCEEFRRATIVPGGFAERARATAAVELPEELDDTLGTFAEPLACVLRGAEWLPGGRVLVVGGGFVGRLFVEVLRRRGDDVFVRDVRPERSGPEPDGPVDAAVLCAPAGADEALDMLTPGGTLLVFASGPRIDLDRVYRQELHLLGSRSATPRHLRAAVELLPEIDAPPAESFPLERFAEGLERYRTGRALKVVFRP